MHYSLLDIKADESSFFFLYFEREWFFFHICFFSFPVRAYEESSRVLHTHTHTHAQFKGFTLPVFSFLLLFGCAFWTTSSIYLLFLLRLLLLPSFIQLHLTPDGLLANKKKKKPHPNAIVPFITTTCHGQEFRRDCTYNTINQRIGITGSRGAFLHIIPSPLPTHKKKK